MVLGSRYCNFCISLVDAIARDRVPCNIFVLKVFFGHSDDRGSTIEFAMSGAGGFAKIENIQ